MGSSFILVSLVIHSCRLLLLIAVFAAIQSQGDEEDEGTHGEQRREGDFRDHDRAFQALDVAEFVRILFWIDV
jgi:hypothetical protein